MVAALAQSGLARRRLNTESMDTKRTFTPFVLMYVSFVRMHTWQTVHGGMEHGQRDLA
jgi:hypothetical protein